MTMLKRLVDLVLALVGLLLLCPLFVLVAVLIKLDSRGPVFFRHKRVGLHGRPFRIFKFRTMVTGAERMGSRLTVKRDPRVTRVGQVLRWFKVDELPQLINVAVGEMSLIGPRPEDPYFVSFYTPEQRRVLSVRPGMVGPSQILGRDELESYPEGLKDTEAYYVQHILPEKLERDAEYVDTWTFRWDLFLLGHGLWATVRGAIKAKFLWRRRFRILLFGADCMLLIVSYCLAFLIRHDFSLPLQAHFLLLPLLITVSARASALMYFGAYQGVFAYFGLWDVVALFKALTLSAVVGGGLTFFVGLQSSARSVFLIDWGLALVMLAGLRYGLRAWAKRGARREGHERQKALIVGAGPAGEQIARTLLEDPLSPYRPVGFIDEMPERWGSLIHGVRVLGGAAELPLAVSANRITTVFVCMSDLSDGGAREVVGVCEQAGVEYRIVPTLSDLLGADTFTNERDKLTGSDAVAAGQ